MSIHHWKNIPATLTVSIGRNDDGQWITEDGRVLPVFARVEMTGMVSTFDRCADLLIHFASTGSSDPGRTGCRSDEAEPPDFEDHRTVQRVTVFGREFSPESVKLLAAFFENEISGVKIEEVPEI